MIKRYKKLLLIKKSITDIKVHPHLEWAAQGKLEQETRKIVFMNLEISQAKNSAESLVLGKEYVFGSLTCKNKIQTIPF